jgi:hypothetical protein
MAPKASQVLDDIVSRYELEKDLIKIASRAVRAADAALLADTRFIGRAASSAEADLDSLRTRLDEMTVVALWIEFERFVVGHIMGTMTIAAAGAPSSFALRLEERIQRAVEFTRFDDLLDVYKDWVDSNDIGNIKQIKQYRDWISHRNPKKKRPAAISTGPAKALLARAMDTLS